MAGKLLMTTPITGFNYSEIIEIDKETLKPLDRTWRPADTWVTSPSVSASTTAGSARTSTDTCGALLATSAVAKGLFRGSPWNLDVSGGFASPLAAELISDADVIGGWGCSLNMWTTRHGKLIPPQATLVQVDDDATAIGAHRPVHLGVLGDVAETARAVTNALGAEGEPGDRGGETQPVRDEKSPGTAGYRSAELRERIADVPLLARHLLPMILEEAQY
jgi:thiamine pyrophosphate-dependent acetolactate synthase large subunit-like protein